MKQLFFSFLLIIPQILFGQNELHLKSGEILNCKVKSLTNGDLMVLFKGNIVHFKIQDIASIIFSKEEHPIAIKADTAKPVSTTAPSVVETPKKVENGEVKGVVTYYFNDNYGAKPDVGAEVLIYKPINDEKYFSVFYKLQLAKIYWSGLKRAQSRKQKDEYTDKLNAIDAYPEDKFEELSNKAYNIQLDIQYRKGTKSTTVDGNGNFSVMVPEGTYNIIFVSNHHHGDYNERYVSVLPNEASIASVEFR